MTISYIILSVICIIILRCVWKSMVCVWLKPRKLERQLRKQGLVGNKYKFLYGDLDEITKITNKAKENPIPFTNDYIARVFPYAHQLANKYGENCFWWIGPTPFINITDPKLLSDIFPRMHEFQKFEANPLVALFFCGIISLEGNEWSMHRKLLNPAFHMERLKFAFQAFYTSSMELVDEWDKLLSKGSSCEIDAYPYFTNLTGDVISRIAFGSTYAEGKRTFELITKLQESIAPIVYSTYIPGWKYVPTKRNKTIKNTNAELEILLKKLIEKKQKAMENGEGSKDDVLGILIESSLKKDGDKSRISFQDIIDELKLFYNVGHDSTSMLLVWTMILLSKHQDWQIRAREEVMATFGMNPPDFEGLQRLKIVKMIINEVLRLYPSAATVLRMTKCQDVRLGNHSLPEGVLISLSIIDAHHNPKYWGDDVKEFKPERFAEGVGKATNGTMSYFPFGWGPRFCIGQNLALIEAKMALCIILQRFCFELSPSYIHAPVGLITLKPQHGAHIILRKV